MKQLQSLADTQSEEKQTEKKKKSVWFIYKSGK